MIDLKQAVLSQRMQLFCSVAGAVFFLFFTLSIFSDELQTEQERGSDVRHGYIRIWSRYRREKEKDKKVDYFKLERESRGNASLPGINSSNLASILKHTANKDKELILTIFAASDPDPEWEDYAGMTAFNINFVRHLNKLNVSNVLIVGVDDTSCNRTLLAGIVCWRDDLDWQPNQTFVRGRAVGLKWFYLQQIVALGYHPIFLDNDAVVVRNPFEHWDRQYDLQTLYDMTDEFTSDQELLDLTEKVNVTCKLYGDRLSHPLCASTGVMFMRATPPVDAFLKSMVDHLVAEPKQWEQEIFQTELLPYIVDTYDQIGKLFRSPNATAYYRAKNCGDLRLQFQFLPLKMYHNIVTLRGRHRAHLSVDTIIAHCGYMHGAFKIVALKEEKMWLVPAPIPIPTEALQRGMNESRPLATPRLVQEPDPFELPRPP